MASRSAFGREKNNTMPGASRTQQRAEAKYNVTTQFPQYDLHFAAASGNLGLVEYALSHGQPINSVLNGVLPLHAACAGGSEVVVKYLIDEGADVNAPRIPRRYSNEKHKSSGLAVGASGSTPLHFAAANGHLGVIKLLLAHGAVPDRPDKHGVTPEMLARGNGWVECADVLAAWSGGRSGDLPPLQQSEEPSATGTGLTSGSANGSTSGSSPLFGNKNGSVNPNGNDAVDANTNGNDGGNGEKDKEYFVSGEASRKLHMKRSFDNALHLFKSVTPLLHHSGSHGQLRDRAVVEPGPPSPSAALHPHSSHSIFPLHSRTHSHSHGRSPSPPRLKQSHPHLHSLFHHHSHSASQLQGPSQPQVQSDSQAQLASSGSAKLNTNLNSSSPSLPQRLLGGEYPNSYSSSPFLSASPAAYSPIPNQSTNIGSFDAAEFAGGGHRRPSLPHIFHEPASPFQRHLSGRKRRPRSAGEDAEQNSGPGSVSILAAAVVNSGDSVDGGRSSQAGVYPSTNGVYPSSGANTSAGTGTTTRKLSSKISLRNLFRRTGGDSSNANAGSEPGSSSGSVSTSFSSSNYAPIYHLAFAPSSGSTVGTGASAGASRRGGRANTSPTPPASPLSASFIPSPSPMGNSAGVGTNRGGRPGSWYRSRIGSEGAGSVPVPRSPLVLSAVELHHRYSAEHLHEEFECEGNDQSQCQSQAQKRQSESQEVVPPTAPRLTTRPSILRGHNRSSSSQSSSGTGTLGGGTRTLRFDDTSSSSIDSPSPIADAGAGAGADGSSSGSATAIGTANVSPETRWMAGTTSAIRLRGTKSASYLRHEHSYNFDEDDEEEEEDYGTSINPVESDMDGLIYEDGEIEEENPVHDMINPENAKDYGHTAPVSRAAAVAGRVRGSSFASTISSSSPEVGVVPENVDGRAPTYQSKEFPFSIEQPPLTPTSVTSESSATTHHSEPEQNKRRKDEQVSERSESRARGESFSSIETDESAQSRNEDASGSSTSAFTSVTTPSPGTDLRMTAVLGEDNDESNTDVPRTIKVDVPVNEKRAIDAVYLHASPTSSLEDLESPDADAEAEHGALEDQPSPKSDVGSRTKPLAPVTSLDLDLRGISNLAEAEALVRRAQQVILESASLPADGPESPNIPLSAQLAAYGEILALVRRFARGEKQREMWGVRDDSDGEGSGKASGHPEPSSSSGKPQSAKEARMLLTQKRRDAALRQRGATVDTQKSGLGKKNATRTSKLRRPHTAEGAPQTSWGVTRSSAPPSTSMTGTDTVVAVGAAGSPHHIHSHSRSTSSPIYLGKESENNGKFPEIAIVETTATPVESPTSPEGATRVHCSSATVSNTSAEAGNHDYPYTRYTIDDARPSLPMRSRTPDPEASTDDFGVPLTRVATAPQQDSSIINGGASYSGRGNSGVLRSDPATRRTGAAHKLSRMGFSVDAHHHQSQHRQHSHSVSPTPHSSSSISRRNGGHLRQREVQDVYSTYSSGSPASSAGSSRSPSKARFGGIKSLVKGLKGKS